MKQNIKIFLIALIIGMAVAFLLCYKIEPTIITNALDSQVTYFYVGTYNNLNEATDKKNKYENAIIYSNKGIYKVVIGVYSDKDVIALMESYFLEQNMTFRSETLSVDHSFIASIKDYELLIKSSDKNYYKTINSSILNQFFEYISG